MYLIFDTSILIELDRGNRELISKISELKKACLEEGIDVKKSEILRAGLHLLTKLDRTELKQAIEQVEKVRTGRPVSEKT